MRNLFVVLICITSLGCTQKTPSKESSENILFDSSISDKKEIFGEWSMCATSSKGLMTQMNVCENVVFNGNGTGYVGKNSAIAEKFSWTLKTPGLKIINNDKYSNFPDTFYYANFGRENNHLTLILNNREEYYYLSRE